MIMRYQLQKEKKEKRDRLVSVHAIQHDQAGHRYDPMFRDYLPISSGKQWRREKHQESRIVDSKCGFDCSKLALKHIRQ